MTPYAFNLPAGDSATLRITLTNADGSTPNLTGWAATFTAGSVTKTTGAGQVSIGAPGNIVSVTISAGDLPTAGTLSSSLVATSGLNQATWYGTVTLTDAASFGNLTTVARVRSYLKLNTTDADTDLAALVASSSAWIVSQLGRSVLLASYLERHDGDGTSVIILARWPVVSVSSVTVDGTAVAAWTSLTGTGYVVDGTELRYIGGSFTSGEQNIAVTYTAGYAVVPYDLELACVKHAAMEYRRADNAGLAAASSTGDSVTYSSEADFAYVMGVIDTYRETVIA